MRPRSVTARTIGLAVLVGLLETVGAIRAGTDGPGQKPSATKPPTFAAAVDVVLIDAVVTDKQGRTVKGLTAEDFVVREDGERQALTSFEAVDLPPVPVGPPTTGRPPSRPDVSSSS
jgi:hypothetical protein